MSFPYACFLGKESPTLFGNRKGLCASLFYSNGSARAVATNAINAPATTSIKAIARTAPAPLNPASADWRVLTASSATRTVTLAVPRPITSAPAIPAQAISNAKHKISKNTAPVQGRIAIEVMMAAASRHEVHGLGLNRRWGPWA